MERLAQPVRVFISEYVCGGAWPEREIPPSLATEGRSMLAACVADFATLPGVAAVATWDRRLGTAPFPIEFAVLVESPADESRRFQELSETCDARLVIAPEFGGVLTHRAERWPGIKVCDLGSPPDAIALCADKLSLARSLSAAGVPTIPTEALFDFTDGHRRLRSASDLRFPIVIKPRDGAGSQSTFLVRDGVEFEDLIPTLLSDPLLENAIGQPFVAGQPVSVALIVSSSTGRTEVFPPAEQRLSRDGRFGYLGGRIPARARNLSAIQDAAIQAGQSVAGLHGYIGIDLIVPDDSPDHPLVVEINPRLTTSYLGYRELSTENLAERLLHPDLPRPSIAWKPQTVEFNAAGMIGSPIRTTPAP